MDEPNVEGIAIIGMSGRFPGARNVSEFWENLVAGRDCISRFAENELEYSVSTTEALAQGQKFIRARAILQNVDQFDAEFFGMYPKEAQHTDPQHRVFLECAWEAVESAGYAPESYPGLIGVYAGLSMNTYLLSNLVTNREFAANFTGNYQVGVYQIMLGNDKDFLPTRVSYKLNLRGPSMAVQTACSTSLVAVCQACSSLLTYQCDMAIAGGVSVTFPQKRDYAYTEEAMVSGDGTCRSFDAGACGTVFGHGAAVVLLKRLSEALADGDTILAVIKGTAVNNDGSNKIGYAAPSVTAQADVVAMAQAAAGVHPESISYIEAHGTATPLGDPIEVAALTDAFRRGGATRNQYCALGTGKTHIGHLDVAAGATGLIKTILQLQNEVIPPLLYFHSPNPKIDFANSPFYPVSQFVEWKRGAMPRRAGVSAFGVGGTNAHVVVEEAPLPAPSGPSRTHHLLLISARTEKALDAMALNLAGHLEAQPETNLADAASTLQVGRKRFSHRRAVCASDIASAVESLRDPGSRIQAQIPSTRPKVAFLFPGQGAQFVNMGRDLYDEEIHFRDAVDECAGYLLSNLGFDIRGVLFPTQEATADAERKINETTVTQPSIFVIEYALACLLTSWGIRPDILVGHSVGEYVAAVMAGVFSLQGALSLLSGRAQMMQSLPSGSMLAVRSSVDNLTLPKEIAVAAVNSPLLTTLSGPTDQLLAYKAELESQNVLCRFLPTSHAFHSSMMDPIIGPFEKLAASVPAEKPSLPWISSCSGTWMPSDAPPAPDYWAKQLRHPVLFGKAMETAFGQGSIVSIEVGPGHALTQFVRQHPAKPASFTALHAMGSGPIEPTTLPTLLTALGRLWTLGIELDWQAFHGQQLRRRIPLPTYPFERKSFWIEAPDRESQQPVAPLVEGCSAHPESSAVPTPYLVIEKQMEILTRQLQLLRRRPAAKGEL